MNEKLKPCPFCGGEAKIVGGCEKWHPTFYDPDSGGDPYNIQCTCCSCSGGYYYEYWKAVRAWNTRANQSEKTDRWIPVSERLPTIEDANEYDNVLTTRLGTVMIIKYWQVSSFNAIAWQPLPEIYIPEPPKEDA